MKNTRDLYEASLVLFTPTRHTKDIEDAYEHEPYIRMFLDTVSENQFEETLYRILEMFHQNKHEIMKTITPLMKEHGYEYSVPIVHYVIDIDLPTSDAKSVVRDYTIRWMFLLEEFLRADAKLSESQIRKIANGTADVDLQSHAIIEMTLNPSTMNNAAAGAAASSTAPPPPSTQSMILGGNPISGMPSSPFSTTPNASSMNVSTSRGRSSSPTKGSSVRGRSSSPKNGSTVRRSGRETKQTPRFTNEFGRRGHTARTRTTGTRGKMYKLAWVPKHKIHSGMIVHPTMKKGTRMLTAVPL